MASFPGKLLQSLFRQGSEKKSPEARSSKKTNSYDSPEPPSIISKNCRVGQFQINGRSVFTLIPKNKNFTGKHVLYLHGGSYMNGFNKLHWNFLAELVKRANCTIAAPDYPLAPVHNFIDSFEMVEVLYQQLLESINSNDLILMGDSAGGGFALALAQKLRNEQKVQPEQIILLSPWLDITLGNPAIAKIEKLDPYLKKEDLQEAGKIYAGDTSPDDYRLSPINGSLNDLGKISIFAGSNEILVADARKLKSKAESEGIPISYFEYENMFHAWMFLNLPESNRAKQEIIDLIQSS